MTFQKMRRVLAMLGGNGWVGVTCGGEISLQPQGQLTREQHKALLRLGFIVTGASEDGYIYRPRRK